MSTCRGRDDVEGRGNKGGAARVWSSRSLVDQARGLTVTTKFPLLVQFVYHPGSTDAEAVANYLHAVLNDDSAVPGLRIPTCFVPDDGTLVPPGTQLASEADRVTIVLLADDYLAVNARRPTKTGMTWADYAVGLRQFCESSPVHRFMPIQITEHGWPIDPRLVDVNFLRAWTFEKIDERRKFIARRLVHLLIRCLRSREGNEDAPPLTIFLSHARIDLEHEPRVVKSLLAHLTANQPEKTWFDSGDIASGSRFEKEIEHAVTDAALLAVATDSYSSRSWCRREVLLAKRHQRPVVVIDAVQEREVRSFPYVGNVPVIRWKDQPQDVVDLLLRETLRHAYAEASLKNRKRPNDHIFTSSPELLTLAHCTKTQTVLYPDPPLGHEELAVLKATDIQVETPLERYARATDLRPRSLVVALSVSKAEDIARFGLRSVHLEAIMLELSRYLLLAGVRLAYGGDLRADGYTIRLADLVRDPTVEQLRGNAQSGTVYSPEIINYIAWPRPITVYDEARLGPLVDVRRCKRPADVDERLDTALVSSPVDELPVDSPVRRFAWARGLTEMRKRQNAETCARVIVGGRLGPDDEGYKGRMPGVLEEVILSIQAKHPVYLVGAFGGCARLVIDALEGVTRSELTWEYQSKAAHSEELRRLYKEQGQAWDEYDDIVALLRKHGMVGLRNGLDVDENRELAATRSAERIVELVLLGLQRICPADGDASK